MATYRNKNDDTIIRGSEFKLNVNMEPIDGQHMSDVDFTCTFICGGKSKTLGKSEMRAVNAIGQSYADNYVAPLDSNDLGKGMMTIRYEADITDSDFNVAGNADGKRHVIVLIPTKIRIV